MSLNPKALARLRRSCEKAKRNLSTLTEAGVEVDCLFDGIDFTSSISRAKFESLNTDLFSECIHIVEVCLQDTGVGKTEVDDILLVGGSTRILKVQELLQEFFNGKELCRSINPDEAVAYGAAARAATLCGVTTGEDMVLVDVTPLSLGVKVDAGIMSVVIPKNTTIPKVRPFAAVQVDKNMYGDIDGPVTSSIEIVLYEGERLRADDNNRLGEIELPSVSVSAGSQTMINVCFEIDINGILNVSAKDTSTGNKSEVKIINRNRLTTMDVDRMMNEAEEYKALDKKYEEMVKAKNTLENYANEQWEIIIDCGERVRDKDNK